MLKPLLSEMFHLLTVLSCGTASAVLGYKAGVPPLAYITVAAVVAAIASVKTRPFWRERFRMDVAPFTAYQAFVE